MTGECTKNIEKTKLVENENKHKCSSCMLYIVLFSIIFTINFGIATYYVYYKYMNRDKEKFSKYDYVYHAKIINLIKW